MTLAAEIKNQDRNYLLNKVYFPDTGESDIDLAKNGKVRVKYNGANYLMSGQSDFSMFNVNRFDAIKNYLKQHTKIIYTYNGVAGNVTDPLVSFVGEISTFTYTPPQYMTSRTDFTMQIENIINSAIIQDMSHQVIGYFTFRPVRLGLIPTVSDYNINVETIGAMVTAAVMSAINTPTIGVHGAFTGPATMTSIIVT
ncbi:MAG: hypothetical protein MJZ34_02925 [Paludibacteraceae bacterium]|nr:hypothetical protein [Paludibacteraceae bacterium]